jgi:hypothetical protein
MEFLKRLMANPSRPRYPRRWDTLILLFGPDSGRPAGMLMYSTFLHEPQLIGFGYALEQALNVRQQPQFLGSVIPILNGGFCTGHQNHGQPHLPHGKIF